jgi:hypothetical protein
LTWRSFAGLQPNVLISEKEIWMKHKIPTLKFKILMFRQFSKLQVFEDLDPDVILHLP